jgi:Protein of unknown function (DUF3617)
MRNLLIPLISAALAIPLAANAQSQMTPGLYEYTIKMTIPGGPGEMPPQTTQRCLAAKDLEGSKPYEMPAGPGSDCQIKDMKESGGKFSYTMACTKPQKLNGTVQGAMTPTTMSMNMTMTMEGMPGPINQSISAKRISDCK